MESYLVLITYQAKPGCRSRFVDAVKEAGILEAIRQETGCKRYEYFYPAEQVDAILLVEEWESEYHQKVHMTQPHMADLMRLKAEYILNTTAETLHVQR